MDTPSISIIIPVLDEASRIQEALKSLAGSRSIETIVVDGGSRDDTVALAKPLADHVIAAGKGRAGQMNAGADEASGDILVFLHADTALPDDFERQLQRNFWLSGRGWGRFDVRLSGAQPIFRLIEFMMNRRSRLTGICTGDQAIFVKRRVFERIGGFVQMPLMEDIEISKHLKSVSPPFCVSSPVITSSRRWEKEGAVKTVLLMWWLRLQYFFGVETETLAVRYYR